MTLLNCGWFLRIAFCFTDQLDVLLPNKIGVESKPYLSKTTVKFLDSLASFDDVLDFDCDNPNVQEMYEHDDNMNRQYKEVPVYILSPAVTILWLYLCNPWRKHLDFDFHRAPNWDNDSCILRFNDTLYLTMHNLFDWHGFALLKNGQFLHEALIIRVREQVYWLIVKIDYLLPSKILNAKTTKVLKNHGQTSFWKNGATIICKELNITDKCIVIPDDDECFPFVVQPTDSFVIVKPFELCESLGKCFVNKLGKEICITPPFQHPHVAHDEPFFFGILGIDKYHHTGFTGKHDWDTHGVYWWMGNMNPHCQFKRIMTNIMAQIPHCVPLQIIGKIVYMQWTQLMNQGIMLWEGTHFTRRYGMVSHQITDTIDRDKFQRHRGCNKRSMCDGMLWYGYYNGCKWPPGVHDLMELGCIMPGPYVFEIWKYLNYDLLKNVNSMTSVPDSFKKATTLTKSNTDIYNNLKLASSLKSTVEFNHTTILGCISNAFKIEWYKMHRAPNLTAQHTRMAIAAYLNIYMNKFNGMNCICTKMKNKITVFNQMCHGWQKLVEILIALPITVYWLGNLNLLTNLIQVTGLLYTVTTDNDRQRAKFLLTQVINKSLVYLHVWLFIFIFCKFAKNSFWVLFL